MYAQGMKKKLIFFANANNNHNPEFINQEAITIFLYSIELSYFVNK